MSNFESLLDTAQEQLDNQKFVRLNVDELIGKPLPLNTASLSIDIFRAVVASTERRRMRVNVSLALPLPDSLELIFDHPPIEELLTKDWDSGYAPSVLIVRLDGWAVHNEMERYEKFIVTDIATERAVHCYYTTMRHRARGQVANPWYSRGINFRTFELP